MNLSELLLEGEENVKGKIFCFFISMEINLFRNLSALREKISSVNESRRGSCVCLLMYLFCFDKLFFLFEWQKFFVFITHFSTPKQIFLAIFRSSLPVKQCAAFYPPRKHNIIARHLSLPLIPRRVQNVM